MTRILIVEDEQHIADGLRFNLEAEGHDAVVARDGEQALELLFEGASRVRVVVLDVMLPGKDGFTVATELRAAGQYVPILMLTARGRPEDVLRGFESGADDYLPKPFELAILMARLKGLQRRRRWNERDAETPEPTPETYAFEGRTLDFGAMEVRVRDKSYRLTQMECDLLRYLVRNAGQAISAWHDARRSVGVARRDRHPRHRQLHRAAAALHRGSARLSEDPADSPRRRL